MIRCASVSYYWGPYASNYVMSELAIDDKFREEGEYLIHIFPKGVESCDWVGLFRRRECVVYFLDAKPHSLQSIFSLRSIFKKENINLIHVHYGAWDIDARIACPFIKTVWHQRMGVNLNTFKQRAYHYLMYKVVGHHRTSHIAISQSVYDAISSLTSNNTYLIPDGISFERLKQNLKWNNRLTRKPYSVLMFAFSAIGKGVDVAMSAFEILLERGLDFELNIVAQKDTYDYFSKHYTYLPEWLRLLSPTDDVVSLYNSSDIFLSASRSEGFCNSILEAIYCGCPVVFSDISGTRWASEFLNTYMYSVENPEELVQALVRCAGTHITESSVNINRALAAKKYSLSSWVESVYGTLVECVQK